MWRGGRRHISDALRRVLSSYILIHMSLKCVSKGPIKNVSTWILIITWLPGNKALSKH